MALFRPVFATPCLPVPSPVAEIRPGRRLAYSAGKGNAAILPRGAVDMGGNVLAEIFEAVCRRQWPVFPIVGFVHDKEREVAQDAAMGGQAVNVYELSFDLAEIFLAVALLP